MIELRTGIPGSGKTLSMVQALARQQKAWKTNPEDARPVYVHGIEGLKLDHFPMPVKEVATRLGTQLIPDWAALPDGALVLIDEAQCFFPPRSAQSVPPEHVAYLNTHRHHGIDIWITTQHPRLIDHSVRALTGKHLHYRRLFGGHRAAVYEFDSCNDSLSRLNTAVISYFPYPKNVFEFYESATVHTKQSFAIPKWIIIPILGVLLGLYTIPKAYSVLYSGATGQGVILEEKTAPDAIPNESAPSASTPSIQQEAIQVKQETVPTHPLDGYQFVVRGSVTMRHKTTVLFDVITPDGSSIAMDDLKLAALGYFVTSPSDCVAMIVHQGGATITATCGSSRNAAGNGVIRGGAPDADGLAGNAPSELPAPAQAPI